MCSQRHRIGRGHDRNVDVLSQMMSDTIPTIDPERAHWARRGVLLSEHKLIDDQRTIRRAEQFAQADGADRRVAGIEVRRTLFECIILNRRALRKPAAKFCYLLSLAHQLNFRQSKFFSLGQIFVGFVRQIGLSTRRIDFLLCHGSYLLKLFAKKVLETLLLYSPARHRMPHSIARRMSERL